MEQALYGALFVFAPFILGFGVPKLLSFVLGAEEAPENAGNSAKPAETAPAQVAKRTGTMVDELAEHRAARQQTVSQNAHQAQQIDTTAEAPMAVVAPMPEEFLTHHLSEPDFEAFHPQAD